MEREAFLSTVRQAAAVGRAFRVHARELPEQVGYCGAGQDPPARMASEIEAVGGSAHVVHSLSEAGSVLVELFGRYHPSTALCWRHPILDRLGLANLLATAGIARLDYEVLSPLAEPEQRARIYAADIGISSVDLAIAETGTLALASCPGQERSASLLPPIHVSIVEQSRIVPDLFDFFNFLEALPAHDVRRQSSNWVLITGPSKTGDLELTLTTGVHGPGIWHVIIIREAPADGP